jgi:arginase
MRLVDGAEAIRGDLPAALTHTVEVPLEAGDEQGTGIHRMSSIALVRERLREVLVGSTGATITIGGDCGVELGAIEHALIGDPDAAVVWFDAHPDLNTPQSSPSGAFTGMVLRTLVGDGPAQLVPDAPLAPSRIVLAGTRATDPDEDAFLDAHSITPIRAADISAETVIAAITATGASSVYLHIDLDVLDPADMNGLGYPEPFGVSAATLVATIKAVLSEFPLTGAGITEFAPASPEDAVDDLPTILRIVGALTASTT